MNWLASDNDKLDVAPVLSYNCHGLRERDETMETFHNDSRVALLFGVAFHNVAKLAVQRPRYQ